MTSNVRRILQSQKTFRNHLDDEEAHLSQTAQTTTTTTAQRPSATNKVTKPAQRRSATPITTPKTESTSRQRKQTPAARQSEPQTPAETPSAPAPATTDIETQSEKGQRQFIESEYDNDPLLRSHIPPVPSERIMQALLSEPPLPYNSSRAGPPITRKSPRFFCCICGYWGKIRCRNCHVRTCGLGCYKVHEDSRCGAFM